MNSKLAIVGILGLSLCLAAGQGSYGQRYSHSTGSLVQGVDAPPPPPVCLAKDPERVVDGLHYSLQGVDLAHGWVAFQGRVIEAQGESGYRIQGYYSGCDASEGSVEFFVTNFPYQLAENEAIAASGNSFYVAKISGTHKYNTVAGGTRAVRMLDYGTVYVASPEEIEAAQKAALAKKQADALRATAAADKALKMNQDLADKGDAYGLMRMGERYRDGEGVEKDLVKARDCLQRASAAGSPTADEDLKKLPEK